MKKILIIIAVALLAPTLTFAQAKAVNTTNKSVTIKSADKSSELMIAPRKKVDVSFAPTSGPIKFYLFYYDGMQEKSAGLIEKNVNKGEFEITSADFSGMKAAPSKAAESGFIPQPVTQNYSRRPTTTLVLVNKSEFAVVALDNVFVGTALAPDQASTVQFTVETGQMEATFKHDAVKEKEEMAQGRKYRQSVFSDIITEGQDSLIITNENLTEMAGDPIVTFAKSLLPYKISFTAGPWKGQALRYGSFTKKATLYEGFNSLSIQFVGPDGLKYQADIEFICTKKDKPIVFREVDIKNKKVIKQ